MRARPRSSDSESRADSRHAVRFRRTRVALGWVLALGACVKLLAQGNGLAPPPSPESGSSSRVDLQAELETGTRAGSRPLTPLVRHEQGLPSDQTAAARAEARNYQEVLRQKVEGKWFAALVEPSGPETFAVRKTFASWDELSDYVTTNRALVELWAEGAGGSAARRLRSRN